jgi:hypothetical protein
MLATLLKSAAGLILGTVLLSSPASADSFNIFVGYADSLRTSGFFPSPWLGAANVVSESTTAVNGNLDSGAIRIDNTGPNPITITNMKVVLNGGSGPTFQIWGALTILPGQMGIFTQFDPGNNAQFDTSDSGFLGTAAGADAAHPLGGCTVAVNAAICGTHQPIISFLENGTLFTGNDTGHILDTFGYDLVNLGPPAGDNNESINWTTLGSGGSRGGDVPEPGSVFLLATAAGAFVVLARKKVSRRISN